MTRVYVYICPVDGRSWEIDKDRGETAECPVHAGVFMLKEGSYEE